MTAHPAPDTGPSTPSAKTPAQAPHRTLWRIRQTEAEARMFDIWRRVWAHPGECPFQRYVEHLPAAGEIVLFDRSWYNRAGVERVMGFCTDQEYRRFLHQCPTFERMLLEDGVLLRKYWFSVSDAEQERRFRKRLDDPMRRWKLSAMDLESISRWEEYSRAKDEMFVRTNIPEAPWFDVESDDKRRARINMISHLLSSIPYHEVEHPPLQLPERPPSKGYERPPRDAQTHVPDHAATLRG